MPRVVLASDKFKGSLPAAEVHAALIRGLRRALPGVETVTVPVADGGDGTVAAALSAGFREVTVDATGPTGEPVEARYARRGPLAVVELAEVCGLLRLPGGTPAPLSAGTRGLGEVVAAAVDAGCRWIVLGVGGSASTDGGAGMLQALGAALLDGNGDPVGPGGAELASIASIDVEAMRERLDGVGFTVACDVDNPLTGLMGAAAVYGPQKGASADDVVRLDAALVRFADVVADCTGTDVRNRPGAGAAGGVGFAALALLDAELRPGIDLVLELVGFEALLTGADLVVTGEGSLDTQTLHGKAVAGVAAHACRAGVPVVAVCGRNGLGTDVLVAGGIRQVYALTDLEPDVARCIADASPLLERFGAQIAADQLRRIA